MRLLVLAAAALVAALAASLPAVADPAPPPQPLPDVVVTAPPPQKPVTRAVVDDFVTAVGVMAPSGQLATWRHPPPGDDDNDSQALLSIASICPRVIGLPQEYADFITARLRALARTVHAPVSPASCGQMTVEIVFPNNAEGFIREAAHKRPGAFGFPYPAQLREDLQAPVRPIRGWYSIKTVATGDHFSRVSMPHMTLIKNVMIIVDRSQTQDVDMGQLADYVSLLALAPLKTDVAPPGAETILNLFSDLKEGRPPAASLTAWDLAYLSSFYGVTPRQAGYMQNSQIEHRMMRDLKGR